MYYVFKSTGSLSMLQYDSTLEIVTLELT